MQVGRAAEEWLLSDYEICWRCQTGSTSSIIFAQCCSAKATPYGMHGIGPQLLCNKTCIRNVA